MVAEEKKKKTRWKGERRRWGEIVRGKEGERGRGNNAREKRKQYCSYQEHLFGSEAW
jgi:hypothetical protein